VTRPEALVSWQERFSSYHRDSYSSAF
jgi:hypothetical protein